MTATPVTRTASRLEGFAAAAAAALFAGACCAQQDSPHKPIRPVVPYPPGGPPHIVGRLANGPLGTRLGPPVVVDNRGGAATATSNPISCARRV